MQRLVAQRTHLCVHVWDGQRGLRASATGARQMNTIIVKVRPVPWIVGLQTSVVHKTQAWRLHNALL